MLTLALILIDGLEGRKINIHAKLSMDSCFGLESTNVSKQTNGGYRRTEPTWIQAMSVS